MDVQGLSHPWRCDVAGNEISEDIPLEPSPRFPPNQ